MYRIHSLMFILLMTSVVADTIVLNAGNSFTDELEIDASIYKSGASSPVIGKNVEFICGSCADAVFDDAVPKIGGGEALCGYTSGVPNKILNNDDRLCARSILTDNRYDIDILTWVAHNKCSDIDGSSCSSYENSFAYIRTQGLILKDLEIEIGKRTVRDLQTRPQDYRLSADAAPDDEIDVFLELQNGLDSEIEARVEVIIEDIDDGDDLEEESDEDKIEPSKTERFKLGLDVPNRVDEDSYPLFIKIEAIDESGSKYLIQRNFILDVDKDRHDIRIDDVHMVSERIGCGEVAVLSINIVNYGSKEEDDVSIKISNKDTELMIDGIDLDTGTDDYAEYSTEISINPEGSGDFEYLVEVFRNGDNLEDSDLVSLFVNDCEISDTPMTGKVIRSVEEKPEMQSQQEKQYQTQQVQTEQVDYLPVEEVEQSNVFFSLLTLISFLTLFVIVLSFIILIRK